MTSITVFLLVLYCLLQGILRYELLRIFSQITQSQIQQQRQRGPDTEPVF